MNLTFQDTRTRPSRSTAERAASAGRTNQLVYEGLGPRLDTVVCRAYTRAVTDRTIPIRLEEDLIGRLDALATALTERAAGAKVTRTGVMRVALERGVQALEAEVGSAGRRKPKR